MEEGWLFALKTCPLYDGISIEELRGILPCMEVKIQTYRHNDLITIAGEPFSEIGVVVNGNIALTKETAAGNRVIISVLSSGEIFGEMFAYSGQSVWPITVIAQTNCTIVYFPQEKIIGCCEKVCFCHKQLILNMLKIVSRRALLLNRKVLYLSIKSLRGKISTYLLEEYNKKGSKTFQLNLNRNDWADFINVSRPSLSRELGKMRDDGIIDFHGSAVKIIDHAALKELSE